VHIPKAAGGSVRQWFRRNNFDLVYIKHKPLPCVLDYDYDTSFTVIRNTYHRLHSLYNFNLSNLPRKLSKKRNRYSPQRVEQIEAELIAMNKGIDAWIDFYINELKPWTLGEWCELIDHVLHMEKLDEDFKQIQTMFNCNDTLLKESHVNTDKKIAMTGKFVHTVSKYFHEEINYYGYKP